MPDNKEFWIKDSWDSTKGRSLTIKVKKHLDSYRSDIQKIDVYDTESFGKVLTLDDVIMITDFDEFSYHEMISHVPLHTYPDPKNVLIIGGGDGGTAREALKHDVNEVHLCEIDEEVINVSKKYFPDVASSFKDKRMKIFCEDGAKFIEQKKNYYDVIIVDSSDPIGPAEILFTQKFYKDMFDALTSDGIVVSQSESMFYDKQTIKNLFDFNKKIYPVARYYYTLMPTYPSGTIGFSFCSKKYDPKIDMKLKNIKNLKYYNNEIHKAAFILPNFIRELTE